MRHITKKLAVTATAAALTAVLGVAVAQTDTTKKIDPMATPQEVQVNGSAGQQIYFLHDQGNSPESDPSAHLILLKHDQMQPVPMAESTTTTTTTVAQATTPADPTPAMPAATDTSAQTSADTSAAPVDAAPALAPKADRN